jgi:YebC/PmpR family DNA-binding regulatory protein
MSGHNRWSKIKHKKGASDAKKSKVWTKVIKEITISARSSGDVDSNPRLRTAVDKARSVNMPNDTIERAIKKGTGELEGVNYEEFNFEAYGPGGTAILMEIMTDNRNRTTGEIRNILTKGNGNLGSSGSVAYMFKKLGIVAYDKSAVDENKVTDAAIELGADDVRTEDDVLTVITEPKEFERIRDGLKAAGHARAAFRRSFHGSAEQGSPHRPRRRGRPQAARRARGQRRRAERLFEPGRRRVRAERGRLAEPRCRWPAAFAFWASTQDRCAWATA